MKALRHALLLLLMVFCSTSSLSLWAQDTTAPLPAVKGAPTTSALARLAPEHSTIQRIRNRGNLMIAGVLFDYQPFSYLNAQGEIAGFAVDLLRAIAEQWAIDVQFVPVTPSTRIQSLVAGQVDLVAAMPHTTAAEALIDFSQSYFADTPALLVRSDAPTIDLTTLAGKTIAAIQGDEATATLQTALAAAATAAMIMPFQEYAPALLALKAGQADALLADSTYLTQAGDALPIDNVLLPLLVSQSYGIGVAQGDAYFRHLLDATLSSLQQRGAITALYAKWFPERQAPLLEQLPDQWPYTFANSPSVLALPAASRLGQMQTRGKLLVGVAYDFAPFGFLGDDGQLRGFDIALSREFARRWLGDADALELVRVTPATAIPLLVAGQVDLIVAALPLTWANRAVIDFSQSYFLDGQSVLTRADSSIQELADLDQKVVAVIGGAGSANSLAPTVLPFQELRSAQQALLAGQVDALIGSSVALSQTAQTNPNLKVAITHFVRQPYAIGIPQFDAELRDQVNLTLQAMQMDGMYTTLYEQWLAPAIRVTAAKGPPPTLAPALTEVSIATPQPTGAASRPAPILWPTATPIAFMAAETGAPMRALTTTSGAARLTLTATAPVPVLVATGAALPTAVVADATTTITTGGAVTSTVTLRPGINVNARRAPAATAPIVEVLVGGTTWPRLAVAPDGAWIQIQLPGDMQAWVAAQLVLQQVAATPRATGIPTVAPPPVEATATPAVTATPRLLFTTPLTHRVNAADTLATIAKQYYGDQALWRLIYAANRDRIGDDPNAIPVGAELVIPPPP